VLEFLIGGGGGDEEAFAVAGCEAAYYSRAGDCAVADGDYVLELGFEDAVEVFGGADGDEGVGICEGGEDADSAGVVSTARAVSRDIVLRLCLLVGVLKGCSYSHDGWSMLGFAWACS